MKYTKKNKELASLLRWLICDPLEPCTCPPGECGAESGRQAARSINLQVARGEIKVGHAGDGIY